jgi:hypothetical protein
MKTVILALLVAVVAALFYYPTLVYIPSNEEVTGAAANQPGAATLSPSPPRDMRYVRSRTSSRTSHWWCSSALH